jgi:hypothetical protein
MSKRYVIRRVISSSPEGRQPPLPLHPAVFVVTMSDQPSNRYLEGGTCLRDCKGGGVRGPASIGALFLLGECGPVLIPVALPGNASRCEASVGFLR